MAWHEKRGADAVLRLAGAIMLAIAGLTARRLFGAANPYAKVTPLCYLLALIGMVSASAGAALAALGHHLFDPVELPPRWRLHDTPRRRERSSN